jgi:hypothetical protein
MRKLARVLDDSTPDIDHASGVQSRIRVLLPPEASTFATQVQVTAKACVDESLQAAKGLARIGMAEVIYPSPYRFFQAPPRGECYFTLALRYDFTSIKLSKGTFTLKLSNMLGTQRKEARYGALLLSHTCCS